MLCSGKSIEFPPVFSNLTFSKIKPLGLQRNKIRTMSLDYINKFHQLQVLDISDQDIGGSRCVYLEFDPLLYKIWIIGERNDMLFYLIQFYEETIRICFMKDAIQIWI